MYTPSIPLANVVGPHLRWSPLAQSSLQHASACHEQPDVGHAAKCFCPHLQKLADLECVTVGKFSFLAHELRIYCTMSRRLNREQR